MSTGPIDREVFAQSKHQFTKGKLSREESREIKQHIEGEGYEWVKRDPNRNSEDAKKAFLSLIQHLEQAYTKDRETTKDRMHAHAQVVEHPPSRVFMQGARFSAIVITFTEVVIIAISIMFTGQTLIALVVGIVLAMASYFSGLGFGTIMYSAFKREARDLTPSSGNVVLSGWVRFGVALSVASVMAWLRSENGRNVEALVFTAGFTALIVTFTAIGEFLRCRYEEDFTSYFLFEAELAANNHRSSLRRSSHPLRRGPSRRPTRRRSRAAGTLRSNEA